MERCSKCGLWEASQCNCLQGCGPKTADVMIVGEALGAEEEIQQAPFVGQSGQLLTDCLMRVGLDRTKAYITNVIKCRPVLQKGKYITNRPPKTSEIKACFPYLEAEIQEIRPQLIVCLGSVAMKALTGKKPISRGIVEWSERWGCNLFFTWHPSAILRSPNLEGVFIKDLTTLAKYIKGEDEHKYEGNYQFIDDTDLLDEVLERVKTVDKISLDYETTGLNPVKDRIGCIGLSWQEGTGVTIPVLRSDLSPFWSSYAWMKELFNSMEDKLKIVHNLSFEYSFTICNNLTVGNRWYDTLLAHFILYESAAHDLESLAYLFTPLGNYKQPLLNYVKENKLGKEDYLKIPYEILYPYNCGDVDSTLRLYSIFDKSITEQGLRFIFDEMLMKFQPILTRTELTGVQIDAEYLRGLRKKYAEELIEIRSKFKALTQPYIEQVVISKTKPKKGTEKEVNINSSQQLGRLLFDVLKLPSIKKTNGGQESTDEEVLKKLEGKHEIPAMVLRQRAVQKDDEYMERIEANLDEYGRVHTEYRLWGTVTGRLSSSQPNLQNMRKGPEARNIFIAKPGYTLIEADFVQQELKILSSMAGDVALIEAFKKGDDIHKVSASAIYKVNLDKVTEEQRAKGKNFNFAVGYGATEFAISELLLCTKEEAIQYIENWYQAFSGVKAWKYGVIQNLYSNKFVENLFHRRRRFSNIDSLPRYQAEEAEREAVNFIVQSTGNDIACLSAIAIEEIIRKENIDANLILTVHDSLTFECRDDQVERMKQIMREVMSRKIEGLSVDMSVDLKIGKRWGDAKKE